MMFCPGNPERPKREGCLAFELVLGGIRECLAEISRELQQEGLPVTEEGRVRSDVFTAFRTKGEISEDEAKVEKCDKKWRTSEIGTGWGEIFEILKTLLFHEFLNESFVVVRASRFDDIKNGIDNIIIDKETGSIVCAFDEVSALPHDRRSDEKTGKILSESQQGTSLKYSLVLKDGEIVPGPELRNIPIFCLRLSPKEVKRLFYGFKDLKEGALPAGSFSIFQGLIESITEQALTLKEANISEKIRVKIEEFIGERDVPGESSLMKLRRLARLKEIEASSRI
jgi:hypothetical protein